MKMTHQKLGDHKILCTGPLSNMAVGSKQTTFAIFQNHNIDCQGLVIF